MQYLFIVFLNLHSGQIMAVGPFILGWRPFLRYFPGPRDVVPVWIWYGFLVRIFVAEPETELRWKV